MSKKLILVIAVLMFAFVGTTFAAVENIKVSGDINTEAVNRDFAFGGDSEGGTEIANDEQYIFSQVRIRFDADLTEGVSAVVRLINERIWGGDAGDNEVSNGNTDVNLDLAYVELKEFLYQPLTITVGRQELRYGNGLIIADVDSNRYASLSKVPEEISDLTLRKSFDAVRGVLDFAPWTVDLVFAKVEESSLADKRDDVTIIGANAAYDWSSYNGVSEVYFYSVDSAPNHTAAVISDDNSDVFVLGTRAQADLNDKLTLGGEVAYQFGDRRISATVHRDISAYALQTDAEYRFLDAKNSKVALNYTYLSGDDSKSNSAEGSDYNGWDPLFEDQSPGEILNILFGNTNMQYLKASASTMPKEDVSVGIDYTYARLAETSQAGTLNLASQLDTAAEGYAPIATVAGERDIGHEIGLWGVYDYTEDVQLKLNGAWLIPGHLFAQGNDNTAYSVRGGINVNF